MKKLLALTSLISLSLPHISSASPAGHVEPEVKWSKNAVKVCWGKYSDYQANASRLTGLPSEESLYREYSEEQKKTLREVVTSEFTKTKTGLEFVGWEDCAKTSAPDLFIFKVNSYKVRYAGMATIGESGTLVSETFREGSQLLYKKFKNKVLNYLIINMFEIGFPKLPAEQDLQLVFLHELGHTAGLRHEHIDAKAKKIWDPIFDNGIDQNCLTTKINSSEYAFDSTKKYGLYDHNSIMNYCYIFLVEKTGLDFIRSEVISPWSSMNMLDSTIVSRSGPAVNSNYKIRIGLSLGDQHALKCLYKYDAKTFQQTCHPNFDPK